MTTEHIQVQHDPKIKTQIKDALYQFLYEPIQKQFQDQLERIAVQNSIINRCSHNSFMYRNVLYNCDPQTPLPRKMNRLHPKLHATMNEYLRETSAINEQEMPYVLGYINQVLNSSNYFQDYLRLFPHVVHGLLHQLIQSCPCRSPSLPDETVKLLQQKNRSAIELMKQRMVTNLLL